MKSRYKIMKNGIGVFLNLDMDIIHDAFKDNQNEIAEHIFLTFSNSVNELYGDGYDFVKKAILDNKEFILSEKKMPIIIRLNEVETNPAHYQVESFYPATINWLNEILKTGINEPSCFYDKDKRKFIWY